MINSSPSQVELLWPRQETLQMVLTNLAHVSTPLTNAVAMRILRRLVKSLTEDGKVPFDRWLVISKDELKWSDACIRVFWDNTHICAHKLTEIWTIHAESISFEFIAIFLILHVVDDPPSSPKTSYDTAWPEDMAVDAPVQPVSPTNKHSPRQQRNFNHLPKSPRSPQTSDVKYNNYSKLMKRDQYDLDGTGGDKKTNRLSKYASHSINSLRAKMPYFLRALALEFASDEDLSTVSPDTSQSDLSGLDLLVTRKSINAL